MPPDMPPASLPIATVTLNEAALGDEAATGRIGIAPCPGRSAGGLAEGLEADLVAIAAWGAAALLSLIGAEEMERLGVADLGGRASAHGLEWHHLPITDFGVPGASFEAAWRTTGPVLHDHLTRGRSVLVHCRAGLGRSGLIAARLLVERGMVPDQAIRCIRQARPGAIETAAQEAHLMVVAARLMTA